MSILTGRGKVRKSRSDVPIHRMGFTPPFICIPLYVYYYIWSSLTSAALHGTAIHEERYQIHLLLKKLNDPFRTMVILDLATGLRCSELFALQWRDVLWEERTLFVRRGIVTGVVSDVKTKYS